LEALAVVPGVYVPGVSEKPARRLWLEDLDEAPAGSVVLTPDTELGDMHLMEVSRGCGWGCRFCLAGYSFRPPRYRSLGSLMGQAEAALWRSKRLGLVGTAVSDHPDIETLARGLRDLGAEISVSSLRVKPLSAVLLSAVADSGGRSVAFAPEAGSERLRTVINKGVTEDAVLRAVRVAADVGLRHIKLYFMVGLPTEGEDDIEEIVRLARLCKAQLTAGRGETALELDIAPFVPKRGTPFQRCDMLPAPELARRIARIKRSLRPRGVDVKAESPQWSVVQGLLSRGDARLGEALVSMRETTLAEWRRAVDAAGIDRNAIHREAAPEEIPPDRDLGVSAQYLRRELERARSAAATEPCQVSQCGECGVC